jgi:hypothetical protein
LARGWPLFELSTNQNEAVLNLGDFPREPRRKSMTRAIDNRRRNQKNRNKLAALAKKAKKERNQLG